MEVRHNFDALRARYICDVGDGFVRGTVDDKGLLCGECAEIQ